MLHVLEVQIHSFFSDVKTLIQICVNGFMSIVRRSCFGNVTMLSKGMLLPFISETIELNYPTIRTPVSSGSTQHYFLVAEQNRKL